MTTGVHHASKGIGKVTNILSTPATAVNTLLLRPIRQQSKRRAGIKSREEELETEVEWLRVHITELQTELRHTQQELQAQKELLSATAAPKSSSFLNRLRASQVQITNPKPLGQGSFGTVYRGQWRGIQCAIKFVQAHVLESLQTEFEMMERLDHANIVQVYGIVESSSHPPASWPSSCQPPCLVMEFMGYSIPQQLPKYDTTSPTEISTSRKTTTHVKVVSTLLEYLQVLHTSSNNISSIDASLYWMHLCDRLMGAAKGMAYLHAHGVMHRDIKALNLLLNARGDMKWADFGLATVYVKKRLSTLFSSSTGSTTSTMSSLLSSATSSMSDDARGLTTAAGTYTHMAPEVMASGNYNAAADVFSFGIVLTEALLAKEAEEIVDETRTPTFGVDLNKLRHLVFEDNTLINGIDDETQMIVESIIELAGWCCALDPDERPTADQVAGRLLRIQLEHQARHLRHRRQEFLQSSPRDKEKTDDEMEPASDMTGEDIMAGQVFDMMDQDQDGYLNYPETQLLVQLTSNDEEEYTTDVKDDTLNGGKNEMTQETYHEICNIVGATPEKGLTKDQLVHFYTRLHIGDATTDLEKLKLSM